MHTLVRSVYGSSACEHASTCRNSLRRSLRSQMTCRSREPHTFFGGKRRDKIMSLTAESLDCSSISRSLTKLLKRRETLEVIEPHLASISYSA